MRAASTTGLFRLRQGHGTARPGSQGQTGQPRSPPRAPAARLASYTRSPRQVAGGHRYFAIVIDAGIGSTRLAVWPPVCSCRLLAPSPQSRPLGRHPHGGRACAPTRREDIPEPNPAAVWRCVRTSHCESVGSAHGSERTRWTTPPPAHALPPAPVVLRAVRVEEVEELVHSGQSLSGPDRIRNRRAHPAPRGQGPTLSSRDRTERLLRPLPSSERAPPRTRVAAAEA